jgi:hypothetical protein
MADYCTPTHLKAAGRLNISGTTYDTELTALATAASRWIDRHCNLPIDGFVASAGATRYYSTTDLCGKTLFFDAPLLSVSTLTNGNGDTIDSANYWLEPRSISPKWQITLKSAYSWQFTTDGWVSVAGVWGYSASVPAPVAEAAAMLAGWMFKRYQAALQDSTASIDLGELVYSEAIPKQVLALLQPYRLIGRSLI